MVPSLLPLFLVEALDFIHSNREAMNIHPDNGFLFPKTDGLGPLLPYPLIKDFCDEFEIEKKEAITTKKMRSHFTTIFQLVKSKPNQLKWVQVIIFEICHLAPVIFIVMKKLIKNKYRISSYSFLP